MDMAELRWSWAWQSVLFFSLEKQGFVTHVVKIDETVGGAGSSVTGSLASSELSVLGRH